jgi:hypothetical protein
MFSVSLVVFITKNRRHYIRNALVHNIQMRFPFSVSMQNAASFPILPFQFPMTIPLAILKIMRSDERPVVNSVDVSTLVI